MTPEQRKQILDRIDEIQRGKSGIYPYHVATTICDEFSVLRIDAADCVNEHIRKVMAS